MIDTERVACDPYPDTTPEKKMKTLQEMAVLTILKFGIRYKEIVPTIIQNEIDTVEHTIRSSLTGSEYYEYYRVKDCLEFDISWRHGTWTLFREICSRTTITTREPSAYRQAKKILVLVVWKCGWIRSTAISTYPA